jgi:hypothetical protein
MHTTYKVLVLVFIGLFMTPVVVLAKRIPAPVVEPIVHKGVRYTVPNDRGTRGYILARDAATGEQLWKKTVFRKCICPFLEHDVQWVFIKEMRLEGERLIIVSERGKSYSLNLETRGVKKLKSQTTGATSSEPPACSHPRGARKPFEAWATNVVA